MTDTPIPPTGIDRAFLRDYESAVPIALLRARIATQAKFKPHTDAVGLTPPQWRVIRALSAGVPLDVRTLADRCALMQPSVSRLLKSLEDRGLIRRVAESDSRRRLLTITPKGQQIFNRIAIIVEAVYRDLEDAYGAEDLARLAAMLRRLREVAESLPALPRVMPHNLPPLPDAL